SKIIIKRNFKGKIKVFNANKGATFIIELPKNSNL
ncbi:MAG: hypothetical protein RL154_176, partial [Pseudomonadota bacterium]